MAKLLLLALLGTNAVVALGKPWIGVIVAYIFAIFGPQFIWFWAFEGIRPFFYAAVPAILGFVFALVSGRANTSALQEPINFWMLLLWLSMIVSFFFGPYVGLPGSRNPAQVLESMNKVFLFYFIAVMLIDTPMKIKYATIPLLLTAVYFTYWANDMYLSGQAGERLNGPCSLSGGSIYHDENTFALVFVTTLPFLYFLGWYIRNKVFRLATWLVIPFGWHGIFLTASRGGILGLGVTVFITALRSPKKYIGILLIPALIIAYNWQAGSVMKSRSETIGEYQTESSAQTRIEAWTAGWGMIKAHPITGVGVASFMAAFPDFSDKQNRVAHNTFVQIAAEWGVIGGIAYTLTLVLALKNLLGNARKLPTLVEKGLDPAVLHINEAILVSLLGFASCAVFLSLQGYEIFYFLIVLTTAINQVVKKWEPEPNANGLEET